MDDVSSTDYHISIVTEPLEAGFSLTWDEQTSCIFFVDSSHSEIYKYVIGSKTLYKAEIVGKEPLAFAFPIAKKKDMFIAGLGRKFISFKWSGSETKIKKFSTIAEVDREGDLSKNRLNGAKIDPFGILWAGTMGPEGPDGTTLPAMGSLFTVQKGTVKKQLSDLGIPTGLAWDNDKMYFTDTMSPEIVCFDYNKDSVSIDNKRVVFNVRENNIAGFPDGLLLDSDQNLWVAMIHGSAIIRINPGTSKLLLKVEMPTPQPTSMVFGWKNLNTMYVTTSKLPENGTVPDYPAGCTYRIENLGTNGMPDTPYIM